jgi:ABC-type amino acid transport substrate-binding protein
MRNDQMGKYQILNPPLIVLNMAVGFSPQAPDYKKKLAAVNQGLSRFKQDGTYRKIMSKWGIDAL